MCVYLYVNQNVERNEKRPLDPRSHVGHRCSLDSVTTGLHSGGRVRVEFYDSAVR